MTANFPGDHFRPVDRARHGARRFAQQNDIAMPLGRVSARDFSTVRASREGPDIGRAYMEAPSFDPEAVDSFRAFRDETGRQFEFMTGSRSRGGLGIEVGVMQDDPYPDAPSMVRDVRENSRLNVLSTRVTGGHPILSDDDNDMFRAVHDLFGHAATGRGFSRHGEEAAWLHHSQMYSPRARGAMSAETRGQNSAFIFSLGGKDFPEQKVTTLPPQYADPSRTVLGRRRSGILGTQFHLG